MRNRRTKSRNITSRLSRRLNLSYRNQNSRGDSRRINSSPSTPPPPRFVLLEEATGCCCCFFEERPIKSSQEASSFHPSGWSDTPRRAKLSFGELLRRSEVIHFVRDSCTSSFAIDFCSLLVFVHVYARACVFSRFGVGRDCWMNARSWLSFALYKYWMYDEYCSLFTTYTFLYQFI